MRRWSKCAGGWPSIRRSASNRPSFRSLWLVQKQEGWVSEPAIRTIAELLEMPTIRVLEVATFYTMFHLQPVGKHHLQVCGTTPCMLRGSEDLKAVCKSGASVPAHHVTEDGKFSWEEMECMGACVNAPIVAIHDYYYHEDLTPHALEALMDKLARGEAIEPGSVDQPPAPRRPKASKKRSPTRPSIDGSLGQAGEDSGPAGEGVMAEPQGQPRDRGRRHSRAQSLKACCSPSAPRSMLALAMRSPGWSAPCNRVGSAIHPLPAGASGSVHAAMKQSHSPSALSAPCFALADGAAADRSAAKSGKVLLSVNRARRASAAPAAAYMALVQRMPLTDMRVVAPAIGAALVCTTRLHDSLTPKV
jgi:NADH-quinone oxidoreductase subunit E